MKFYAPDWNDTWQGGQLLQDNIDLGNAGYKTSHNNMR